MQILENKCPVCLMPCDIKSAANDLYWIPCPRCGDYTISFEARINFSQGYHDEKQRALASSALREMEGDVSIRTGDEIWLFSVKDLPVLEKLDKLLLALNKRSYIVGAKIQIENSDFELMARAWVFYWEELRGLLTLAQELNQISCRGDLLASAKDVVIKAEGWRRIAELSKDKGDGSQGFVAMSFNESLKEFYSTCIAPAIRRAGYKPHRVDERDHAGRIDDEIVMQIRRSRFIVADMTEHKGGVYYEAGLAHGLGLKVFLTCRHDDLSNLHFDIQQYNCLKWFPDKPEEFIHSLAARIEAELGRGPLR